MSLHFAPLVHMKTRLVKHYAI